MLAAQIVTYIFVILVFLALGALLARLVNRLIPLLIVGISDALAIVFLALHFHLLNGFIYSYLFWIFLTVSFLSTFLFLFANMSEFRSFISARKNAKNPSLISFLKRNKGVQPEELFDREALLQNVYRAVLDMSRLKRGALITFMRKDNILDETKIGSIVRQRGVDINAPFVPELVETIFYEGTRLHDGAIVVKGDKILRASVFFVSTERPLTGKYGSRHQAAIGISENSDAVTIVVSEETGRISIAFMGDLTPVTPDNFLRVFEDDMNYESPEEENNSLTNTNE